MHILGYRYDMVFVYYSDMCSYCFCMEILVILNHKMPYKYKLVGSICRKNNISQLNAHLRQVHGLDCAESQKWVKQADHSIPDEREDCTTVESFIFPTVKFPNLTRKENFPGFIFLIL